MGLKLINLTFAFGVSIRTACYDLKLTLGLILVLIMKLVMKSYTKLKFTLEVLIGHRVQCKLLLSISPSYFSIFLPFHDVLLFSQRQV